MSGRMSDEEWARMTGQKPKKPAAAAKPAPEKKKKKKKTAPPTDTGLGQGQMTLRQKIKARHEMLSNAGGEGRAGLRKAMK